MQHDQQARPGVGSSSSRYSYLWIIIGCFSFLEPVSTLHMLFLFCCSSLPWSLRFTRQLRGRMRGRMPRGPEDTRLAT